MIRLQSSPPASALLQPPLCACVPVHVCMSMPMAVRLFVPMGMSLPVPRPSHGALASHPGHPLGLAELRTWSRVLEALGSSHHGTSHHGSCLAAANPCGCRAVGRCRPTVGAGRSTAVSSAPGPRPGAMPLAACLGGGPPQAWVATVGGPCLPLPTASFRPIGAGRAARGGPASSPGQCLCLSRCCTSRCISRSVNNTQQEPQRVVGTALTAAMPACTRPAEMLR